MGTAINYNYIENNDAEENMKNHNCFFEKENEIDKYLISLRKEKKCVKDKGY